MPHRDDDAHPELEPGIVSARYLFQRPLRGRAENLE